MTDVTQKSSIEEQCRKAFDLLDRVADVMECTSPDETWWREYFLLKGLHMIRTDEGWESGEGKQFYLDDWDSDSGESNPILEEINAP